MKTLTNNSIARPTVFSRQTGHPSIKRQRGASLIELMMSVFAMVAIVGFVFWMKSVVWGPLQGWMEASSVSSQLSKVENVFSGAANYTGLTTAAMATPSIFNSKYLPGGGLVNNRFGGSVTLGITTINTASDTLTFTDAGVRTDSCPTLVNQLADEADRITVAGTVVKANGGTLNASTLKTQCDSGATVSVMFERIKRA